MLRQVFCFQVVLLMAVGWGAWTCAADDSTGELASKGQLGEDDPASVATTEVFEALRQQLVELEKGADRRPSIGDFHRIVKGPDGNYLVGRRQRMDLWEQFAKTQGAPLITMPDLAALATATRESIWSLRTVARHQIYSFPGGHRTLDSDTLVECVRNDGKALFRTTAPMLERTMAYDGELLRRFDISGRGRQGSIQNFPSREILWEIDNDILLLSMLVNTEIEVGSKWMSYDLPAFLDTKYMVVFAEIKKEGDSSLLRVGNPGVQVLCDVDKSFAVTRLDVNTWSKDGRRDVKVVSRTLSGHEQFDGVWLPRKVVIQRFAETDDNSLVSENVIEYREIAVNQPVADELFRDVIPDGVPVVDGIRNVMFVSGGSNATIDEAVRRSALDRLTTPGSSRYSARLIVVLANGALILAVVVTWLWRRMAGS